MRSARQLNKDLQYYAEDGLHLSTSTMGCKGQLLVACLAVASAIGLKRLNIAMARTSAGTPNIVFAWTIGVRLVQTFKKANVPLIPAKNAVRTNSSTKKAALVSVISLRISSSDMTKMTRDTFHGESTKDLKLKRN